METTGEIKILTAEEALRLRLIRLVHKVLPPSYTFAQKLIIKELERASPATLEKIRLELLELLK